MCLPGLPEQVHKLVEDARAKGARVLTGGELTAVLPSEQFYPPTILADVTHNMLVWQEETFGPLMTVAKCSSDAHAVCLSLGRHCDLVQVMPRSLWDICSCKLFQATVRSRWALAMPG